MDKHLSALGNSPCGREWDPDVPQMGSPSRRKDLVASSVHRLSPGEVTRCRLRKGDRRRCAHHLEGLGPSQAACSPTPGIVPGPTSGRPPSSRLRAASSRPGPHLCLLDPDRMSLRETQPYPSSSVSEWDLGPPSSEGGRFSTCKGGDHLSLSLDPGSKVLIGSPESRQSTSCIQSSSISPRFPDRHVAAQQRVDRRSSSGKL